jgi:hypothetical protein
MSQRERPSEVDELAAGLRARIDEQLERRPPRPDVAAVLARASELDAEALGEMQAGPLDTGVFGTVDISEERRDREALRPLTDALRERVDGELAERRLRPLPAAPTARRRVGVWAAGFAVAAAAVVVLVIGTTSWMETGSHQDDGAPTPGQALDEVDAAPVDAKAVVVDPPDKRRPVAKGSAGEDATPGQPEVAPLPQVDEILGGLNQRLARIAKNAASRDLTAAGSKPRPIGRTNADRVDRAAPPSVEEQIATLDTAAQALWREGNLVQAQSKFREITRIGGLRRAVELAYAELFALVRQQGGDPQPVWREYLQRFPKGRYAEDAQAGLCRRASGGERERCWAQYRERFPNGMHAPKDIERK